MSAGDNLARGPPGQDLSRTSGTIESPGRDSGNPGERGSRHRRPTGPRGPPGDLEETPGDPGARDRSTRPR